MDSLDFDMSVLEFLRDLLILLLALILSSCALLGIWWLLRAFCVIATGEEAEQYEEPFPALPRVRHEGGVPKNRGRPSQAMMARRAASATRTSERTGIFTLGRLPNAGRKIRKQL